MALLSIIIPVYNVEKYISRCIDSIVKQDIDDVEIIFINDGSTDSSGTILDSMADINDHINVIHVENGGVSHARNIGLQYATGKYIAFIDPDDWVTPDYLTRVENKLSKMQDVQFLAFGYSIDYAESDEYFPCHIGKEGVFEGTEEVREAILCLEEKGMLNVLWNKVYLRSVIEKNKLRFDETMIQGEDLVFNCEYLQKITECVLIQDILYHYMRQEEASLTKKYDPKLIHKIVLYDTARKRLYDSLGDSARLNELRNSYYVKYVLTVLYNVFGASTIIPRPQRLELLKRIYADKRLEESIGDYSDRSVLSRIFRELYCINSPVFADTVYSILFWLKRHFKKLYIRQRTRLMGSK